MTEQEIFAQAAKAAAAKIPSIEKKIENLRIQMDELTTELNQLRMFANYGKVKPNAQAGSSGAIDHPGIRKVAEILDLMGPLTAKEIKDGTADDKGTYGQSTIYSYLAQGRALGLFEQTADGKWNMAK